MCFTNNMEKIYNTIRPCMVAKKHKRLTFEQPRVISNTLQISESP